MFIQFAVSNIAHRTLWKSRWP